MSKRIKIILIILGLLAHGIIFTHTLMDGPTSAKQSGVVIDVVDKGLTSVGVHVPRPTLTFSIRKAAHMTEFMFLGLMWMFIYLTFEKKLYMAIIYAFTHGITTAILDETMQAFIPKRGPSVGDVGFDAIGVTIGILVSLLLVHIIKKKQNKRTNKKVDI